MKVEHRFGQSSVPHRFLGYLEEEVVISYTQHLNAIERGEVENVPAPAIAIDYWRLPKDATLKDVVTVIRADEAHHRDVNHFASVSVNFHGSQSHIHLILSGFLVSNVLGLVSFVLNALFVFFFLQDIHHQGKELKEAPAPVGYH